MKNDKSSKICELKDLVKTYCEKRNWDQFHTFKELSISLSVESSELLQKLRFKDNEEIEQILNNKDKRENLTEEIADIFYTLIRISQKYDIDLTSEFLKKMEKNSKKYPVDKFKDSNKKYDEI